MCLVVLINLSFAVQKLNPINPHRCIFFFQFMKMGFNASLKIKIKMMFMNCKVKMHSKINSIYVNIFMSTLANYSLSERKFVAGGNLHR